MIQPNPATVDAILARIYADRPPPYGAQVVDMDAALSLLKTDAAMSRAALVANMRDFAAVAEDFLERYPSWGR